MDDRKLKILTAVVDEYIVTGEPVGSKAIMKHVKASSATIRNEMAELEKQGYLEQPHTSAGRVPTYNGYRLYVDMLTESDPLSADEKKELDEMLGSSFISEDDLVQNASLALAQLTKCATVVADSTPKFSMISKVEVIPTGKRMYVILMVTSSGTIKNKAFRLEFDLDNEQLEFFNNFIKENLDGIPLSALSDEYVDNLVAAMGAYMMTLSPIFSEVIKMTREIRSQDVKVFSDLHVMFSDEKDGFVIHNSSVITAPYKKNGENAGSLGLIGPMRLDYKKFIPYLEYFTDRISQMLTEHDSLPAEIDKTEDNE